MRKSLYLAALSVVATLAFSSVAMAQYITGPLEGPNGECSGAADLLESELPGGADLSYLPDVDGCIDAAGSGEFGPLANSLNNYAVYDPDTGELLGFAKDLDPDLSSGANSVTYQEFCGDFDVSPYYTPQRYYAEVANAQEQAILDPNGDGQACTAEDGTFSAGDPGASEEGGQQDQYTDEADGGDGEVPGDVQYEDGDCSRAAEEVGTDEIYFVYVPELNGCIIFAEGVPFAWSVLQANALVYDAGSGQELGLVKDLVDLSSNPDFMSAEDFSGDPKPDYSTEGYCAAFPLADEITAQDYHDGVDNGTGWAANAQEKAILDPDGDGVACTAEDEAFLAEDPGADDGTGSQFGQTWTGQITQTGVDGTVTGEYGVEADIVPVSEMTGDLVGEVVGEVSYPELDCSGVWVLEVVNEGSVRVEERIEEGVGLCLEFLPITLTPQGDGSLEYSFENEANGDTGRGVLTLRGSSVPDGDVDSQQPSDVQQPAPGDGEESASEDVGEPAPVVNRTEDVTNYVAVSVSDFGAYCAGTVNGTVRDLRQGGLPDTGGEWTVLLFSGTALVGGGWFLVRRFSR